jgi:uncharacterized paraquat-inducible protein A
MTITASYDADEQQTACLLCGLLCDRDKWTCHRCHERLMAQALTREIDITLRRERT